MKEILICYQGLVFSAKVDLVSRLGEGLRGKMAINEFKVSVKALIWP